MFPKSTSLSVLAAALFLAGCGRAPARAPDAAPKSADADYAASPRVDAVRSGPQGAVLSGVAAPGAPVRLNPPGGQALTVQADGAGRWSLALPPAADPRIFGLSEVVGGRQVQGQGYVLVSPDGKAALLRAGAGALRLDARRSPALEALDYDAEGGAVVSGLAPPDSLVFLKLDGRQVAQARADRSGRYAVTLNQAAPHGRHTLEVSGDAFVSQVQVEVGAAAPLVAGPLRSQFVKGGLRVDWLTPGGGVQTTVLTD